MREQFVNRYVLVLGKGGLGATAYEIHATAEDLEVLAETLLDRLEQFRTSSTPIQKLMAEHGLALRPEEPTLVLNEYITLSQERTDRTTLSFHVAPSLVAHHEIVSQPVSTKSIGVAMAKFFWFVILPLIGIVACFKALLHVF